MEAQWRLKAVLHCQIVGCAAATLGLLGTRLDDTLFIPFELCTLVVSIIVSCLCQTKISQRHSTFGIGTIMISVLPQSIELEPKADIIDPDPSILIPKPIFSCFHKRPPVFR